MQVQIRAYEPADAADAAAIWNEVVEEGVAFPQTELLTPESGHAFFSGQTFTGLAYDAQTACIFCIRTTSAAVGTSATRATR